MEDYSSFIAIAMFVALGTSFSLAAYFRFRGQQEMHQTIRASLEHDPPLPAEFLDEMLKTVDSPDRDRRRGILCIATSIAIFGLALAIDEQDAMRPLLGIGLLPLTVGLAYLLLFRMRSRRDAGDRER